MKKTVKRFVSFVCVAGMCFSLVACKENVETGKKTATIWMNSGHSKLYWEEKVDEYNRTLGKKSGIKLVLESKTDDTYTQALEIAMQSNQLPEFYFAGNCEESDELNVAYPLSDLPGMEDMIEKYRPYMRETIHKMGDKVYQLPFGMTTRGLIYNKDMFKAAGLVDENGEAKPPKTLEEVREYAKLLTDESKQQYGIVFPVKWSSWVDSDIATMTMPSTGKIRGYDPSTGVYDYSVYEPILNMVLGIKKDGSYYPGAEGLDNDPARAKFSTGAIGMKISYSFDVGVFNTQFPATMDWGVAPLPVADPENCYKQPAVVGSSIMVSSSGVEKLGEETAAEIMKFLYSDESIAELYKQGLEIPCIWDIAEGIEPNSGLKGWAEFAEMSKISAVISSPMPMDIKGHDGIGTIIINKIWGAEEEPKAYLDNMSKIVNEGVKKYQDTHPERDYSIYIDEEWNEKIGRNEF